MSAPNYKYVKADDWAGIYINGDLAVEGHSIRDDDWIDLINDLLVDGTVDQTDRESEYAYEVIQAHGRCPAVWPGA
jgi:hypothetical protein